MAETAPGLLGTTSRCHVADAEQLACHHAARTAERHEREPADIEAPRDEDRADCLVHVGGDDPEDTFGGFGDLHPEGLGNPLTDGALGSLAVEHHLAREEVIRIQPIEGDAGVGDGGLRPAQTVAGRAGPGARALRPHAERPARIDPGDAAAAGPDGQNLDGGRHDRPALDRALVDRSRQAVRYHAHVAAGAADVDGRHVAQAHAVRDELRADDAAGRARHHGANRQVPGGPAGDDAAVRLHHEEIPLQAPVAQRLRQAVQIGGDDRDRARVDRDRRRALELPQLARDIGRDRDVRGRVLLQDELPRAALMVRVGVGMEEAERDGANVESRDAARDLAGAFLVQRTQHLAGVTDALADLEAQMARDDRLRLDPFEVVHARVVGAHDLQHIPEPRRGHQRSLRQLPLQQCVEHDGCAMHEVVDIGERDVLPPHRSGIGQDSLDAAQHAFLEIARRRERLRDMHAPAGVQQHQVGEGAADVRGKPGSHRTARCIGPTAKSRKAAKAPPGSRRPAPTKHRAGRC